MKKFKNLLAQQLFDEAEFLEQYVNNKCAEFEKNNLPPTDYYLELLTEAAGLRVLADEVEEKNLKTLEDT